MFGRQGCVGLAAVLAVVLGSGGFSAAADETVCKPVTGFLDSAPTPVENIRYLSGDVAPFGKVKGLLAFTSINQTTGAFTAVFSLVGKDGTMFGTITGQFLTATTYFEVITFTFGTGAYWRVSGGAELFGTLNPDGTARDVILSGKACFPK